MEICVERDTCYYLWLHAFSYNFICLKLYCYYEVSLRDAAFGVVLLYVWLLIE